MRCPAVVQSLQEAGDDLITHLRFPSTQWEGLLFGLRRSDQVKLRALVG
jgi:hypothetical protein